MSDLVRNLVRRRIEALPTLKDLMFPWSTLHLWLHFPEVAPQEPQCGAIRDVPPRVLSIKHVSAFTLLWAETLETIIERVVFRLGVLPQPLRVFKATKHQLSWSLSQHNDLRKTACTSLLLGLVVFFTMMYVLNIRPRCVSHPGVVTGKAHINRVHGLPHRHRGSQ